MDRHLGLAQASRDGHLALRRVERQHALIERLHIARGERVQLAALAREFRVSTRTLSRDVERLRMSGVPIDVRQGQGGGVSLPHWRNPAPVNFDVAEVAALISSLTSLGPTVSPSAQSAMDKLVAAVGGDRV